MRNPISAQFRRDVKRAQKRGKDMRKLREVILLPTEENPLPPRCNDHSLGGDWKHYRDCHIEPDWLLIYKVDGKALPHWNAFGFVLKVQAACGGSVPSGLAGDSAAHPFGVGRNQWICISFGYSRLP